MELRAKRQRAAAAPQQPQWAEEEEASEDSTSSLSEEQVERDYSDEEDSRRGRASISWTGALEARFLKALASVGGVWEAKPKAILQRMGAYSNQLTTIQVKSHLQKHRIKVAAQMQQQGLPVPTPGSGGAGATPAVAAAAQQVAAAAARQRQSGQGPAVRGPALKVRSRGKAGGSAGQQAAAEHLQQQGGGRRSAGQHAPAMVSHGSAPAHLQPHQALYRQQHHELPPMTEEQAAAHHAELQRRAELHHERLIQLQHHQAYQQHLQRRRLLLEAQQRHGLAPQQQQWVGGGGLAGPASPQQLGYDAAPAMPQHSVAGGHGMHGVALHARHMLSSGHGHPGAAALHGAGFPRGGLLSVGQLEASPGGPSHENSPITASSGGAGGAASTASDWEALLRMEPGASPRMLSTRHGSLMHLHGGAAAGGSSAHQQAAHAHQHQHQHQHQPSSHQHAYSLAAGSAHQQMSSHPSAPPSVWANATVAPAPGPIPGSWPELGAAPGEEEGSGGPMGGSMLSGRTAGPAASHHKQSARLYHRSNSAPVWGAPHHTSDSDSDHYAELGDLLDMPALLGGGNDAFDAFSPGLDGPLPSPVTGGAGSGVGSAGGAGTGRPAASTAAAWSLDASPFF